MGPDALRVLADGAAEIVPEGGLAEKLTSDRPLRVKLGVDPSRPDLTLGHAVVLRKLRQFQDAGHVAVLIVGDFTARIGDPSGTSETRPMLSAEEVAENARTYLEQAGKVLDVDRAEIHGNAEWSAGMEMSELLRLASVPTVAQMLEREDFRARYQQGRPISVVEFLYPLFQGFDSVAVHADVELGGTDQTFNLLMGREVQRAFGQDPQLVLTMPLLEGTDGVRKMSKSFDNYVGLTESPDEMFGKLMSIPDGSIIRYLRLATDEDPEAVDAVERGLAEGSRRPNDEKRLMARRVVDLYHGAGSGLAAQRALDRVHRERRMPERVEEVTLDAGWARAEGRFWLPRVLWALGLASSNGDGRRRIEQGGIRLDGEVVTDPDRDYGADELRGRVLQSGRRRFVRLV
jgi:tyrosyl-tRNA synthetase